MLGGQFFVVVEILRQFKNYFNLEKVSSAKTLRHNIFFKRCLMKFNKKCFKTSEIVCSGSRVKETKVGVNNLFVMSKGIHSKH